MDQYTRTIIGFGIQAGVVDGPALCRMFKHAIRVASLPKYLSSDHDPLYRFHQWEANLRVLGVTEIKTVPYTPWSHPFIERLIGTVRRECLDRLLFWTATDLERKLIAFRNYYNGYRCHAALKGETPIATPESRGALLNHIVGSDIVVGCTRLRWLRECEFATHTLRIDTDAEPKLACSILVPRRRAQRGNRHGKGILPRNGNPVLAEDEAEHRQAAA